MTPLPQVGPLAGVWFVRSCSEITCTYDAGQTFICKEENAAVAGYGEAFQRSR